MVVCSSWTTARSRPAGWSGHQPGTGGRRPRPGGRRPTAPRPARRPALGGDRELVDRADQQPQVGRVGHIGGDHGGVGAELVGAQQLALDRPVQERLVQLGHGVLAQAAGELDQRGRVRHLAAEWDVAEPLPRDRVGDLAAQQLIAQPVAVLVEHQPQVGIDRDRGTAAHRIEVGPEGLDEHQVVSSRSTLVSSAGSPSTLAGKIASHRLACGLVVRSTPPPIRCATRH
jgi:hypothetical protein